MLSLGLDPSVASFGWSIVDSEAQGRSRIVDRSTVKTTPEDFFLDRYDAHDHWLRVLLTSRSVDVVGLEASIFGEEYSEGAYALHINVLRVLRSCRKDVVMFLPPQLKALARGHMGGVKMLKADMVSTVKRLVARPNEYHVKIRIDEHQADATLAAWFGARFFGYLRGEIAEDDLSDAEQYLFAREHTITRGPRKGFVDRSGLVHREGDRFFLFSKEPISG